MPVLVRDGRPAGPGSQVRQLKDGDRLFRIFNETLDFQTSGSHGSHASKAHEALSHLAAAHAAQQQQQHFFAAAAALAHQHQPFHVPFHLGLPPHGSLGLMGMAAAAAMAAGNAGTSGNSATATPISSAESTTKLW